MAAETGFRFSVLATTGGVFIVGALSTIAGKGRGASSFAAAGTLGFGSDATGPPEIGTALAESALTGRTAESPRTTGATFTRFATLVQPFTCRRDSLSLSFSS